MLNLFGEFLKNIEDWVVFLEIDLVGLGLEFLVLVFLKNFNCS